MKTRILVAAVGLPLLLVVVLGINGLSSFIAKRIGRSHT